MPVKPFLELDDVRTEARAAIEDWAIKADPPYKKRFYKFFKTGPEGFSRGSVSTTTSAEKTLTPLEEAEKELELRNWSTMYQQTCNGLGQSLKDVQQRAQGDVGRVLQPLLNELMNAKAKETISSEIKNYTGSELNDFVRLMRSLSIAYEQSRNAYSSEYLVQYVPKEVPLVKLNVDFRASSLSAPVTYAPPKVPHRTAPVLARMETPKMVKPAPRPEGQKNLLAWGGGGGIQTSSYRMFHGKPMEKYPNVIPSRWDLSMACGRIVPEILVDNKFKNTHVSLPVDRESRRKLRQAKLTSQPSWHLLFPEGIIVDKTGKPHDVGERSIYMKVPQSTLDAFLLQCLSFLLCLLLPSFLLPLSLSLSLSVLHLSAGLHQ